MADAETVARGMYNSGGGSYAMPDAAPVQGAAQPAPAQPSPTPTPEPATAPPEAPRTEAAPMTADDAAEQMYGAPTRGLVDWNEPAAQPADFNLNAPPGMLDVSEAGKATMVRFREGLSEAGAGPTLAAELFNDAIRAEQGAGYRVSQASGEADLRREYGTRYEVKIESAKALIRQVAVKCPEIIPFLDRTGLGNNPEFIRKVIVAAGRRR